MIPRYRPKLKSFFFFIVTSIVYGFPFPELSSNLKLQFFCFLLFAFVLKTRKTARRRSRLTPEPATTRGTKTSRTVITLSLTRFSGFCFLVLSENSSVFFFFSFFKLHCSGLWRRLCSWGWQHRGRRGTRRFGEVQQPGRRERCFLFLFWITGVVFFNEVVFSFLFSSTIVEDLEDDSTVEVETSEDEEDTDDDDIDAVYDEADSQNGARFS